MNDQDITTLMQNLKETPDFNRSFDVDASWNLVSKRCGLEANVSQECYDVRDYVEYYVWQFSHVMMKPLMIGAAVFVLLVGTWIGASNVSTKALPGDLFYPVKLSLEKTQLFVAFSPEQKAKLQVEFTSRRLEEMVELTAHSYQEDASAVLLAVRQFKKEVQTIREYLQSETQSSTQTELAKELGRKSTAYKATVADSGLNAPANVKDEVDEVQALLEETSDEAVSVIITAHETSADEATAFELGKTFEKELADVLTLVLDGTKQEKVDQAIVLKDAGEYRRAFQLLKEVKLEVAAASTQ